MGADAGLIYLYDFVLETSRAMLAFSSSFQHTDFDLRRSLRPPTWKIYIALTV